VAERKIVSSQSNLTHELVVLRLIRITNRLSLFVDKIDIL